MTKDGGRVCRGGFEEVGGRIQGSGSKGIGAESKAVEGLPLEVK